jgi:hypothetical protein
MPAAARRSKSEAYEQGIREGMAMSRRARVMKPSEEEEEMEMDTGMDPNHSRKRSAKGAKHTKPATDGMGMKKSMDMCGGMKKSKDGGMYGKKPMDAECGCMSKGRKGKCDGSCGKSMKDGGYMKKMDSLTPQEYLTACELGIQDRSTAYIRARLDAAERLDLKCGKGAISEGEKCTKGPAQKVQPKQPSKARTIASAGAILGGVALNAGATGYGVGKALSGDIAGAGRAFQVAGAGQALMGVGARGLGRKKESKRLLANAALTTGAGTLLREQQTGELAGLLRKGRMAMQTNRLNRRRRSMERAFRKPSAVRPPRRDSIYATGFSADSGSFDI